MDKEMIDVINTDGSREQVELVTYLVSDDKLRKYVVYTKGEIQGNEGDQVIYISKLFETNGKAMIEEITDDNEWSDVLNLLKRIANAK